MLFGYCRVSTEDQIIDRQIDALKNYGVPEENIYTEKMTGTKKHRPALDELKNVLRKDDTLVIESFSRLGRSTQNLLDLLQEFQEREIKVISLKEQMDFSSATGKLTITIMAALLILVFVCSWSIVDAVLGLTDIDNVFSFGVLAVENVDNKPIADINSVVPCLDILIGDSVQKDCVNWF